MKEIERANIGITSMLFTLFALPRVNVGNEYTKEIKGLTCTYHSPFGIPHTPTDRKFMERTTTCARRNHSREVDMGSVTSAIVTFNMGVTGTNIQSVVKAIERWGGLSITSKATIDPSKLNGYLSQFIMHNMHVADSVTCAYGHGRFSKDYQPYLPNSSIFTFSQAYYEGHIAKLICPHNQADYMAMRSPLVQDIYVWLVKRMFLLHEADEFIAWPCFFAQYFQAVVLKGRDLERAKRKIKAAFAEIKKEYYPDARFSFSYQGVTLYKSPLLLEPEDKRGGFVPGGSEDWAPLDIHWSPDGKNYTIGDE